jgi:hypothetical protein
MDTVQLTMTYEQAMSLRDVLSTACVEPDTASHLPHLCSIKEYLARSMNASKDDIVGPGRYVVGGVDHAVELRLTIYELHNLLQHAPTLPAPRYGAANHMRDIFRTLANIADYEDQKRRWVDQKRRATGPVDDAAREALYMQHLRDAAKVVEKRPVALPRDNLH